MPKEIKPAWSFNYIAFTLVMAILVVVVGYLFKVVVESSPNWLTYEKTTTLNLLKPNKELMGDVVTTHKLTENLTLELQSFFRYSITINNRSDPPAENLTIVIKDTINSHAQLLIEPPEVKPCEIRIEHKQVDNRVLSESEIGFLNGGESVKLSYKYTRHTI